MSLAITKTSASHYVKLMKPGIIFGNLITMMGGFFLASTVGGQGLYFLTVFCGVFLLIGSACAINCIIDVDIDAKMTRTMNRPLPLGLVTKNQALIFAMLLGLVSFVILAFNTNPVCVLVSLLGFVAYVFVYSFWKPLTHFSTLLGSVSGAIPPVIGYTAVSQVLDVNAALLFLILALWQMPHFYAISIFRMDDYKRAEIPVLPLVKGIKRTRVSMILYTGMFALACPLLFVFGSAGVLYLLTSFVSSVFWLYIALKPMKEEEIPAWARKIFIASVMIITLISVSFVVESMYFH